MKIIRLRGSDYTEYMKNIGNARHKLNKSLWDEFGQVRITNPSGRFIGIVRQDPGEAPSSDGIDDIESEVSDGVMEAQADNIKRMKNSGHITRAPSPRSCKCKDWPWDDRELDTKNKPVSHHPKCAFKRMYERDKGHKIVQVVAGPTLEPTIHKAGKVTNPAINRARLQGKPKSADKLREKITKVPMPERCPKCKDFTKSKKMEQDQHHPTCEYFKKYKAISHARAAIGKPMPKPEPLDLPVMLLSLDTMVVVREAEPDEIAEGRRRLRDEGTAFAEVDGEHYLCMHEDGTTLEPAEGEQVQGALESENESESESENESESESDRSDTAEQASA